MSWFRSKNSRGASLIELTVASLIVLLLMLEIWRLVAAGSRFYHRARSQSDVQRNSLIALRWMAKDLSEGSTISFREYKTDGPTPMTHAGIVFGSPTVPGTSSVNYDAKGRMIWSSVIGYFIDPADKTLYRQQIPLADPSLPSSTTTPSPPTPWLAIRGRGWWRDRFTKSTPRRGPKTSLSS